jgi:hypothetical protein
MRKLRRPSHSTIVAYLALFIALGAGGAYAADTIGSSDVIDESLLSRDIKNGQVRGGDIALDSIGSARVINGSLSGADIGPDSILGTNIDEATLKGVDAAKVRGDAPCQTKDVLAEDPGGIVILGPICESGPLKMTASCTEVDNTFIRAEILLDTSADDSFYGADGPLNGETLDANFNAADPPAVLLSVDDKNDPGASMQMHEVVAGVNSGPDRGQIAGVAAVRAERGEAGTDCQFVFYGDG